MFTVDRLKRQVEGYEKNIYYVYTIRNLYQEKYIVHQQIDKKKTGKPKMGK
jgi:hypothetical protein